MAGVGFLCVRRCSDAVRSVRDHCIVYRTPMGLSSAFEKPGTYC